MLSGRTLSRVASYWSADFGCPVESLLTQPLHLLTHGPALAGYNGVFALFRNGMATVSFPPAAADTLRGLLPNPPFTPAEFSKAFERPGFRIIGPASLSYAELIPPPHHAVRSLTLQDQAALQRLQAGCEFTEWEHGGSDSRSSTMSGVFAGDDLVAVAGYEQWGEAIAHISVVTHPSHRGRGYGRSVVADIAGEALSAGLIPQYRTLESNGPSMSIARSLGFIHYATSVAVKLEGAKSGTVVATDVTEL